MEKLSGGNPFWYFSSEQYTITAQDPVDQRWTGAELHGETILTVVLLIIGSEKPPRFCLPSWTFTNH